MGIENRASSSVFEGDGQGPYPDGAEVSWHLGWTSVLVTILRPC